MSKIQCHFSTLTREDVAVANPYSADRNQHLAIVSLLISPAFLPGVSGTGC